MSRLNGMQDHELAIQSILNELALLEHRMACGQRFRIAELNDLGESLLRLTDIIGNSRHLEQTGWETDNEPLHPGCSQGRVMRKRLKIRKSIK